MVPGSIPNPRITTTKIESDAIIQQAQLNVNSGESNKPSNIILSDFYFASSYSTRQLVTLDLNYAFHMGHSSIHPMSSGSGILTVIHLAQLPHTT